MSLMYVKYGNFRFQDADPTLAVVKTAMHSPIGTRIGITEMWTLTGELIASSQDELTVMIRAFETAFNSDFKDLILYDNNGQPSAHALYNKNSSSGVRIVSWSWPDEPGQYVISRKYQVSVKADFLQTNPGIVSYVEVIQTRGGGPKWILKNALKGVGQRQQLNEQTPFYATQQGSAVGYLEYPPVAPPIWKNDIHLDQSSISRKTPTFQNNQAINWEVTWNYVFESFSPLIGKPGSP